MGEVLSGLFRYSKAYYEAKALQGKGKDVILAIDIKGALRIKRKIWRGSIYIYLAPPSVKVLKRE